MSKDGNYRRMIQSNDWLKLRKRKLTAFPICEDCKEKGLIVPAQEVHHVVPCENADSAIEMQRLMFDYNNLRALCRECHAREHAEMKSHSKKVIRERADKRNKRFAERFL